MRVSVFDLLCCPLSIASVSVACVVHCAISVAGWWVYQDQKGVKIAAPCLDGNRGIVHAHRYSHILTATLQPTVSPASSRNPFHHRSICRPILICPSPSYRINYEFNAVVSGERGENEDQKPMHAYLLCDRIGMLGGGISTLSSSSDVADFFNCDSITVLEFGLSFTVLAGIASSMSSKSTLFVVCME